MATVAEVTDRPGLRRLLLDLPTGFDEGLAIGASVASDGVCLTVTSRPAAGQAAFDVMAQTLSLTTLGTLVAGSRINVERAAGAEAEVGGHVLSGHVDCCGSVVSVHRPENNHVLRISVPPGQRRYLFTKGYIAVNGASLTIAEADRAAGWFDVWLIPETLRLTTFGAKAEGDKVNLEFERGTVVMVDTVRELLDERLGPLMPALQRLIDTTGAAH